MIKETLKINIKTAKNKTRTIKVPANVRKTLDGSLMFNNHPHMIILLSPGKRKIVVWPKEEYGDITYDAANRFFTYLIKKGVVLADSFQGTGMYGGYEAEYPESQIEIDETEAAIFSVATFLDEEREHFAYEEQFEKAQLDALIAPDDENSTELGEVPQMDQKGTIPRAGTRRYVGAA